MKKYTLSLLIGIFAIYELSAHVDLLNPQGGEMFSPGETVTIQWQIVVEHNTINWDLFFSGDGGSTWNPIQADMPVGTLSYQWSVPDISTTEGRIKIVQDNEDTDYGDISSIFTIETTTAIRKPLATSEAKVYPNPFNNSATLSFHNPGFESHTLTLFDVNGRIERKISRITTDRIRIERGNLKSGLYFFHLSNDKGFRYTGKLTIQ